MICWIQMDDNVLYICKTIWKNTGIPFGQCNYNLLLLTCYVHSRTSLSWTCEDTWVQKWNRVCPFNICPPNLTVYYSCNGQCFNYKQVDYVDCWYFCWYRLKNKKRIIVDLIKHVCRFTSVFRPLSPSLSPYLLPSLALFSILNRIYPYTNMFYIMRLVSDYRLEMVVKWSRNS